MPAQQQILHNFSASAPMPEGTNMGLFSLNKIKQTAKLCYIPLVTIIIIIIVWLVLE